MGLPARIRRGLSQTQLAFFERSKAASKRAAEKNAAEAAARPLMQNGAAFLAGVADKAFLDVASVEMFGAEFTAVEMAGLAFLVYGVMDGNTYATDIGSGVTCVTAFKLGQIAGDSLLDAVS